MIAGKKIISVTGHSIALALKFALRQAGFRPRKLRAGTGSPQRSVDRERTKTSLQKSMDQALRGGDLASVADLTA